MRFPSKRKQYISFPVYLLVRSLADHPCECTHSLPEIGLVSVLFSSGTSYDGLRLYLTVQSLIAIIGQPEQYSRSKEPLATRPRLEKGAAKGRGRKHRKAERQIAET